MLNKEELLRFRQHFPQLASETTLYQDIATKGALVKLPAGQHICLEGDNCPHLALVLNGTGRVYKLSESGREITLYRVESGECCILTLSCILSHNSFPAFALSETALEGIMIPASAVNSWMSEQTVWQEYAWQLISERLGGVISLVEEVTFRRMDERLKDYLKLLYKQSDPCSRIKITHQQIAADLGTSREVVSRLLKDMHLQGKIELGRGWLCNTQCD